MITGGFEPKIVAFLCNWCSYAAADKAGTAQKPYPHNVSIVKVMCSGRVEPSLVMQAYEQGADGVLVLACHPGDCHYKEGNYREHQRIILLKQVVLALGIEDERLVMDFVSASEADKYVEIVTRMVESLKTLGPLKLLQ